MKKLMILIIVSLLLSGCALNNQKLDSDSTWDTIGIASTEPKESTEPEQTKAIGNSEIKTTEPEQTNVTESSATKSTESPSAEDTINGKYVCSSEYFKQESFIQYPKYVTWITFNENNHCIFHINYMEGLLDAEGTYQVEGNTINVELDLEGTHFDEIDVATGKPYMDDRYIFEIIDNDHIIIGAAPDSFYGGKCYAVKSGDTFVRQ